MSRVSGLRKQTEVRNAQLLNEPICFGQCISMMAHGELRVDEDEAAKSDHSYKGKNQINIRLSHTIMERSRKKGKLLSF